MVAVDAVTLEGEHVRLEPLSREHAEPLLAAAMGPRDTYGFTWVPSGAEDVSRYIDTALAQRAAGRSLPFATVERRSGRVVGSTRYCNIEFWEWPDGNPNRREPGVPDVVEIGWTWLAAEAQRTAVNTEAKLLMLDHAFERWQVHRVSLLTDARNAQSRAAILRLGARFDGILRAQRPATDGTVRDTACFSILAREWPEVRAGLAARLQRSGSAGAVPR